MAGLSTPQGRSHRRELDHDLNMVPMIDLLMVTISFLLITAVWSHLARINADAQVPGPTTEPCAGGCGTERTLHVSARSAAHFELVWKEGGKAIGDPVLVPRSPEAEARALTARGKHVPFPELEARIAEAAISGLHRAPSDPRRDQAVLHTDDKLEYAAMIGLIDAVAAPKRVVQVDGKERAVSAFNVGFAVD